MVARKARLGGVGALGFRARVFERPLLFLALGDVAHHRDDLAFHALAGLGDRLIERTATHLDPDELRTGLRSAGGIAANAEFDRLRVGLRCGISERGQIGRAVRGTMELVFGLFALDTRKSMPMSPLYPPTSFILASTNPALSCPSRATECVRISHSMLDLRARPFEPLGARLCVASDFCNLRSGLLSRGPPQVASSRRPRPSTARHTRSRTGSQGDGYDLAS
jgi:hypothetical protein